MEDSLHQYLCLYEEHKDLICRKSAYGFNLLRSEAYHNLKVTGLPAKGEENYEMIDIPAILAPDYGLNISRISIDVNVRETFKCGVPHLSSSLFFLINDMWGEGNNARQGLPDGIEVGRLSGYLAEDGEALEYYGKLADATNPLVALNTMLVQEGVYVRVKKGVKVQRPLQIVNILGSLQPLMAVRRLVIILEEDAELTLLSCDHSSSRDIDLASITVAELFVGQYARLNLYDLEESTKNTSRLMALYLRQEEGSDVTIQNFTLHNGRTRNEYHGIFAGRHARLALHGMGIESGQNVLDNFSRICHESEDCTADELFKYILEDFAQGAFTGRIYVAPGARHTVAYQDNRNLLCSDGARMFTKPQLEIYNDDVKCSHGTATGQLDAMQLFYMRSRGLSDEEAKYLLKQAFMADVIHNIKLPLLRDRLHKLVEQRFMGNDMACGDCEVCPTQPIEQSLHDV